MKQGNFSDKCTNLPTFFLGANSMNGFKSYFHKVSNVEKGEKMYVIKGGPGTGKSTLMKKILEKMLEKGAKAELILCSSDLSSLDGVIFEELGFSIVDGTSPHVVEPKYPGVFERVIPLSEFFDNELLYKNSKEIVSLCKTNSLLHKKASKLIGAAGELLNDNMTIDITCSNLKDVVNSARCISEMFFIKKSDITGEEKIRFISGVTGDGIVYFNNTVKYYSDEIIGIDDPYGAVSSVFMRTVRKIALQNGYDIITCPCAIFPETKIDHIIIPNLRLAFCTRNSLFNSNLEYTKNIHSNRFRNKTAHSRFRERIAFNIEASKELICEASKQISDAKTVHDLIEKHYVEAMDFEGIKYYAKKILSEVEK